MTPSFKEFSMRHSFGIFSSQKRWLSVLSIALLAACGGGGGGSLDPILGSPGAATAPLVIATSPATSSPIPTGVAITSSVTATFNQAMQAASLNALTFTLFCPATTPMAGAITYDAPSRSATLTPTLPLPNGTTCVATVKTGATSALGLPMVSNYSWQFTTVAALDTTRPSVLQTIPTNNSISVAINSKVSAVFSEDMQPASLSNTSFILTRNALSTLVPGSVSYSVSSRTAQFTSTSSLVSNASYTARITTAATDLAGNALGGNTGALPAASDYVWVFTTGAAADITPPTVLFVTPPNLATSVCLSRVVSATFNEAMDASTMTTQTFVITDSSVLVPGQVTYDSTTRAASFTITNPAGYPASKTLVATIKSGLTGVADLAGNNLAVDKVWQFTTGTQPCATPVNLGTIALYGAFGGAAGVTNQGINTTVQGNLGTTAACTLITGFHDGLNVFTETPLNIGAVSGTINCGPPAPGTTSSLAAATLALNDAVLAYNTLAAMPTGSDPGAGELGGLVLAQGVYTAAAGSFKLTSGDLTLDAQGDSSSTWVFQSATSLTIGLSATPRRIVLINGAQAKNIFWQAGSAARIENTSAMVGTIIAPAGVTISTAGQTALTTLTGRAIGLTASVTLVNTTIVLP
jgi:Ice-binding-like/Bacterial Ig-like domain